MKFFAILAAFLLLSSFPFYISPIKIVAGPYLQNAGCTSITIMWITNKEANNNIVRWGTNELENSVEATDGKIHEAKIEGLQPSTKYYYMVESDGIKSGVYTFFTAGNENFTFIVYGDTRGVWDNWKNASKVAEAIKKEKVDIVIHTGDIVRNGMNEDEWIKFFQISSWIHNTTLYPAIGNHDLPSQSFKKYFSLPGNEEWYSFDYGSAHFTILNSNSPFSLNQFLWLIKDLQTKKWKIVAFHHPPYSSGSHGNTTILRIWSLIFQLAKVDIVFNGHDHDYERIKIGSVNYIVTGGGGAPLRHVGRSKWTICSTSAYHYCKINVNSSTLNFTSYDLNGSIIDHFVISFPYQPSI